MLPRIHAISTLRRAQNDSMAALSDARQSTCVHRMEDPGLPFGLAVSCIARVPNTELGPTVGETWLIGRRRRIMVTPAMGVDSRACGDEVYVWVGRRRLGDWCWFVARVTP
jgi:hypothetical protein